MANAKNIEMKAAQVAEIKEKLEKATSVVLFDYRGLTVAEVTALRAEMRKNGVQYSQEPHLQARMRGCQRGSPL